MKRAPATTAGDAVDTAAARWVARRDAGLSSADERELASWLESDPRHREALAFHDAAWAALVHPATKGHAAALKAHLEELAARRRIRRAFAGTVALAAVVGFGFMAFRSFAPSTAPAPALSIAQVIAPAPQTLPDGSLAELKEDARLSVAFSPEVRRIVLHSGEAHFDVTQDRTRPFIVAAAGIEVRALGTAFSVRKGAAAVEVIVTHGTVALEQEAPAAAAPSGCPTAPAPLATLAAGTIALVELTAAPQPQIRAITPAEVTLRLAWRGPRLEFTRTPLAEAVALFNRHAPAGAPQLAVADADLATRRISGVFRAANAEAFVALLESAFEVKAERTSAGILLRHAP